MENKETLSLDIGEATLTRNVKLRVAGTQQFVTGDRLVFDDRFTSDRDDAVIFEQDHEIRVRQVVMKIGFAMASSPDVPAASGTFEEVGGNFEREDEKRLVAIYKQFQGK